MNWLYSCKQVARLLSQRLDEPLGAFDNLRLRLHLSMCSNCSNVDEQLRQVNALAAGLFTAGLTAPDDTDPDAGSAQSCGASKT